MVARDFFWPGMSNDIRRYIRNCDTCGRTKPWRDGLQGLLKPLLVPEQIWKEISIDFIDGLLESDSKKSLMAVTDRLSKDVVFIPLANTETETVVQAFITYVVAYHWIPDAITSDRGTQFVSVFWRRLCEILRINRRISTAFHPQTDGATERMNSTWETYMKAFVNWAQDNWAPLCPLAQIAIKGRDATTTKLEIPIGADRRRYNAHEKSDQEKAESIVTKLRELLEMAQASIAQAQQEQERQANGNR
ncbi:hypothetical protein PtrM4_145170 [Pyrenophora tritici-repentis]|uniref:Integrase catalytic domain-containing protein n=1 Tax=Pyrenophora tritici-repentis TaxID=45151 RepID=A0A834VLH5_9PLEO|nr:hypothetical protein PtrM4_145170 [Pyrenophora tritici-repentis]